MVDHARLTLGSRRLAIHPGISGTAGREAEREAIAGDEHGLARRSLTDDLYGEHGRRRWMEQKRCVFPPSWLKPNAAPMRALMMTLRYRRRSSWARNSSNTLTVT